MSVCLNCLESFKPTRNSKGKFCSLQCNYAYNKSSVNCFGLSRVNGQKKYYNLKKKKEVKKVVRMNLGNAIQLKNHFGRPLKEQSKIFVSPLSKQGKKDLKEGLELQLKFLNQRLISIKN